MKGAPRILFPVALSILATAAIVRGQSICIGYTNCLAVTNYSQPLINQAAQSKWYFAHASVGQLMLEGLTNLHQSTPAFYQLQSSSVTNTPPGATTNGIIYDDARGHASANDFYGDWQYEVGAFQTAVSNGWHYPLVNVAMNILSFVDIWYNNSSNGVADLLNGYVGSMTNLEAAFSRTVFVYATMPVTTTNYSFEIDVEPADDYWREVFNDSLRAWCRTNNRVLFDIADIEAHDGSGAPCIFTYQGQPVEQLWSGDNTGGDACCGEVGDGAHPTNFGAEELLAQGFYALSAAVAQARGQVQISFSPDGTVRLNCFGMPNLGYLVQRSTNSASGWVTVLSTNAPTGGVFQYVEDLRAPGAVPAAYYRMVKQ